MTVIKANMRREATATDPLAQISASPQAAQSISASQQQFDRVEQVPQRVALSATLSPDESAEFMTNAFASRCR